MKLFDTDPISIYQKGLENDIYVDEKAFIETNLKEFVNYKVFKPYKMAAKVKQKPKLYGVIFGLVSSCWFLLNFLYQTKVFLSVVSKFQWKRAQSFRGGKLLIVATPRALDQIDKVQNQNNVPQEYLFLGTCKGIAHKKNHGIYQYLDFSVLVTHFFTSLFLYKRLKLKGVDKLQTLTCQDWLHSFSVLEQIDRESEVWFANHYDRWAILFSYLNCKSKVLLQHGIVNSSSTPPNKLQGVSAVHLISEDQKQFIKGHFVANAFQAYTLKGTLTLSNVVAKDKLRVLIVGNIGMYAGNEQKIISSLSQKPVHLLLKPHPVLSFEDYLVWKKQYNYHFIEDKEVFPDVDLVVSYESTVGVEYAQKDIDVIYYNEKSVDEIIEIILKRAHSNGG
ncbi:MAG: hypothetical protein ACJAZ2_000189 [Glaciecola sp.]|jgi:hypothetical protein